MKARHQTRVREEVKPFALQIPEPFNVKPAYEVELPSGYKARIYETKMRDRGSASVVDQYIPAWRIVVVNSKGLRPSQSVLRWTHHANDTTHTEPLDVAAHLEHLAYALSARKKTTVEENEY